MKKNERFNHESLQDTDSIADLLKALTNGISKGKVTLEDGDGQMVLEPKDLLRVRLTADRDDERCRITLRLSWQDEQEISKKKNLKVK
jgi:amphi-Trp domain-containing protein